MFALCIYNGILNVPLSHFYPMSLLLISRCRSTARQSNGRSTKAAASPGLERDDETARQNRQLYGRQFATLELTMASFDHLYVGSLVAYN